MHISTVYYSQTVETSQNSINRLMDKQNVESVCMCVCVRACARASGGIPCDREKEWSTAICYNVNGPQKHYAK